jgi:hypothetical protein
MSFCLAYPEWAKRTLAWRLRKLRFSPASGAYFMTAHDVVHDLGRAYREGRLDRRMRVYLATKVLIIDEMGYLPLDELGATIFFQLVSARCDSTTINIRGESYRLKDRRRAGLLPRPDEQQLSADGQLPPAAALTVVERKVARYEFLEA